MHRRLGVKAQECVLELVRRHLRDEQTQSHANPVGKVAIRGRLHRAAEVAHRQTTTKTTTLTCLGDHGVPDSADAVVLRGRGSCSHIDAIIHLLDELVGEDRVSTMDHCLAARRLDVVLLEVLAACHALLVVWVAESVTVPKNLIEKRLVVLLDSATRDLARGDVVPVIAAHGNLHRVEVAIEGSHTLAVRRQSTRNALLLWVQPTCQLLCLLGETLLAWHPLRQQRGLPTLLHRLLVNEKLPHHQAVDDRRMEGDARVYLLVSEREEVAPAPILWNQVEKLQRQLSRPRMRQKSRPHRLTHLALTLTSADVTGLEGENKGVLQPLLLIIC